ncbi:hypothetical protein RHMOL_Rhmol09G0132500 [Rhododendron molle]|uniref:Uncharacterized protein n=1 Tax=Rhododendron molle TaxID=49168 RepID=A0ACC0ME99_RHOML|nr:hypothetical protein RHMOL_Rhmol09G0132500 [Rhododendron molle]
MGERSKQLVERSGVTRIFIRDLPEAMDKSWLKHIFLGAVKIIDVYIPRKRSFRLNQRFRRVYRVVKNNIGVGGSKGISVHQNTPRMEDQGTSTAAAGKETQRTFCVNWSIKKKEELDVCFTCFDGGASCYASDPRGYG